MQFALLIAGLVLVTPPVYASELHPQLLVVASGTTNTNTRLRMRASTHLFWAPGHEPQGFVYTGFQAQMNADDDVYPRWTVMVQTGTTINWLDQDELRPLASVWNVVDLTPRLHLFLEGDAYFLATDRVDYYGFYTLEWDAPVVTIGLLVEQVNVGANAGVYVARDFGDRFRLVVAYHEGIAPDDSALRLVTDLHF